MTVVIGTDEAGYGPNLGPLVVAATAWRISAATPVAEALAGAASAASAAVAGGTLWGDSKSIHRGGAGFAALERGAVVALALATGRVPEGWPALATAARIPADSPPEAAFMADMTLPCAAPPAACAAVAAAVAPGLEAAGVALAAIRCRVVQPREFNALLASGLNKSDILSAVTLDLAAELVSATTAAAEPVLLWCDRHGGRRRYAAVVSRAFSPALVRAVEETATRSTYLLDEPACRVEFCVGGEARLPVAVASMVAKYVRELAMRGFNAFWSAREPGLAATAGYPVDAARWRRDAEAAVRRAVIPWDDVWRRA